MKTGMHRIPHTTLKRPALIWYNNQDQDFGEALTQLASNMYGIKQLVIVTEQNKASYATKQLISWFMSQKYDRNVVQTTILKNKTKKDGTVVQVPVNKAIRQKRTARNYVDQLVIKVNFIKAHNQPKDYFRMYILTPQMHIFPTQFTDHTQTASTYLMIDSWGVGQASASSDYDYYKMVMDQVEKEWHPSKTAKDPKSFIPTDYAMYQPLCDAYELDPSDDHAWEQLEWYTTNHEPIVRMPRDEEIYLWFIELGIAPAYSDINSGVSIYDDSNITSIGKEAIMDDMREFNETDLLPEFYR